MNATSKTLEQPSLAFHFGRFFPVDCMRELYRLSEMSRPPLEVDYSHVIHSHFTEQLRHAAFFANLFGIQALRNSSLNLSPQREMRKTLLNCHRKEPCHEWQLFMLS